MSKLNSRSVHQGYFRKKSTAELHRVSRIIASIPFLRSTGRGDGGRTPMLQLFLADGRTEDVTREYAKSVNLVLGGYITFNRESGLAYVSKDKLFDVFGTRDFSEAASLNLGAAEYLAAQEYEKEVENTKADVG